jgi:hypothetical protein
VFVADEQDRPVDTDDLVALTQHVLTSQRVPEDMQVSVLLVDEDTITALNEQHLDGHGPTDVLAFPLDEPGETPTGVPAVLGDVVLCPAVAARQADRPWRTSRQYRQQPCRRPSGSHGGQRATPRCRWWSASSRPGRDAPYPCDDALAHLDIRLAPRPKERMMTQETTQETTND